MAGARLISKQAMQLLHKKSRKKRAAEEAVAHLLPPSQPAAEEGAVGMVEDECPPRGTRVVLKDGTGPILYEDVDGPQWLAIYHSKRPGLQVLQQQLDNFIAEYEAHEEKARREQEAAAVDEGWTVVTHHKGRKKTTDPKTSVTVGAVAPFVAERRAKKIKEAPIDFYRFQKREARRNEVLQLQRRFEEDKKRIAKLKAARKFRPY